MGNNVPCRNVSFSLPEGCRKKGRRGLRWLDSVLKDLKTLEVNARWKKARDRFVERNQGGQGTQGAAAPKKEEEEEKKKNNTLEYINCAERLFVSRW
jgi:hypothetical protein